LFLIHQIAVIEPAGLPEASIIPSVVRDVVPLPVAVKVNLLSLYSNVVDIFIFGLHVEAACHVAAVGEVAVGTYHTAGVPVTVIPHIFSESVAFATALVICPPEILLFVSVSVLEIVGTLTPPACSLPVHFGTMFTFIFVLEPVAVSVIVPVPQATW